MMSVLVLGRNLALELGLGKSRAQCSSTYGALSHNFPGIEVFTQKCLYF